MTDPPHDTASEMEKKEQYEVTYNLFSLTCLNKPEGDSGSKYSAAAAFLSTPHLELLETRRLIICFLPERYSTATRIFSLN